MHTPDAPFYTRSDYYLSHTRRTISAGMRLEKSSKGPGSDIWVECPPGKAHKGTP